MRRRASRQETNPAKKMAKNMSVFAFLTCLVVIGIMFVYYQHKNSDPSDSGEASSASEVQRLAQKDLEMGYPETPTEVLRFLGRVNQCMYNNEIMEGEYFDGLLSQIRMLYSESLLQQNPLEEHKQNLREEMNGFASTKRKIVNYTVDKSSSVKYRTIDGKECAYVQMAYFFNEKGNYSKSFQDYVMIRENDRWKVLAFKKNEKAGIKDEKTEL